MAAARTLAAAAATGALAPDSIDEAAFAAALGTARRASTFGLPGADAFADVAGDPDVVIRTSGERRLSNFLLWQAAWSELVFCDALWPDFGETQLADALREYAARSRRFGGHE